MEQIIEILKLVLPSLVLTLFALHYQLRKKVEIRIEKGIAMQRIQAYEALHAAFGKILRTQTSKVKQQPEIESMIAYYGFDSCIGIDYPEALATEQDFDAFFHTLQHAVNENSVFLDYHTKQQVQRSMNILSQIKSTLDAFCDAERTSLHGKPVARHAQQKIDYAYLLAGIMLKSYFNKSYLALEDTLTDQMSNIEVVPSRHYVRRIVDTSYACLLYVLHVGASLRNDGIANLFQKLLYGVIGSSEKIFGLQLMKFRMLLAYVDISDRYSFQDYLHLSEKKRSSLYQDYELRMNMQMHTTWIS